MRTKREQELAEFMALVSGEVTWDIGQDPGIDGYYDIMDETQTLLRPFIATKHYSLEDRLRWRAGVRLGLRTKASS